MTTGRLFIVFIHLVALSSFLVLPPASAQSQPSLGGKLVMGLSITGSIGSVYSIEATTNVGNSNGWVCVAFVQLLSTNYLWIDNAGPVRGERFYRATVSSPTNLVFIPPGGFRMGSPTNEPADTIGLEQPQTEVELTKGFYIGKYLVTQGDYLAVIGTNPSYFNTNHGFTADLTRPVEMVSWEDATNYCAKRTELETAGDVIPPGSHYRPPSELEWEYACRALTSTRFYYGDDPFYTNFTMYGWCTTNSGNVTQPVGLKPPNAWGLYDMAGNVWEWCDWFRQYPGGRLMDPQPADNPVGLRVMRGGSWSDPPANCRSAARFLNGSKNIRLQNFGFRVVLVPSN